MAATRRKEFIAAIEKYQPGSTIRLESEKLVKPPNQTRIGLFGPTGVGKSALINSFLYVTGDMWNHLAPEGYQTQRSTTLSRPAYDITEKLKICDNRGLKDFSGNHMTEVANQLSGKRIDGEDVVWDQSFMAKLIASLTMANKVKEECKIHCPVLILSAGNLIMRASDMKGLVDTIVKLTGEPPIVIITHKDTSNPDALQTFKDGLFELNIQFIYLIENYTKDHHTFDETRHVELLEALNQCTIVADKTMKHAEGQGGFCTTS